MDKQAPHIPTLLIGGGILLIVLGLIYWAFQGKMGWIGRLPGDIRVEKENFSFYMPISTMILFSIALSLLMRFGRILLDFYNK